MRIFEKTLTGKTITLQVEPSMTSDMDHGALEYCILVPHDMDIWDSPKMDPHANWQSPLSGRYCRNSPLLKLFSEQNRIQTWRQLWCWLAKAEQELGIKMISEDQICQMEANINNIDWTFARNDEAKTRHDVMAHIHTFEKAAPLAAGVIHLGATSAFVQDNADLIIMRDALDHCIEKVATCLNRFDNFATKYKEMPTVGRTHYQAATFTTVGKRGAMWAQDVLAGFKALKRIRAELKFRGIKGATGSQASFLTLFRGDDEKVEQLDARVTELAGFSNEKSGGCYIITGQTYTRNQDAEVLNAMSLLGAAIHRFCLDMRLLQAFNEIMEPFESSQIGSSAMPYKQNPMRSERVDGITRSLMNYVGDGLQTAALQGLERTLDDSSNRRLTIAPAFLTLEAALMTMQNILEGMRVVEEKVAKNVQDELPFLALEPILMELTLAGANRQEAHERIRKVALQAKDKREKGEPVDLVSIISGDPFFNPVRSLAQEIVSDPRKLTGRCAKQVEKFMEKELRPEIEEFKSKFQEKSHLNI